jgi:tripartite ATP-independent transporter DctM subunit
MDPMIAAVLTTGVLFLLLALGMPIAFTMTLVGFGGLVLLLGLKGALSSLAIMPFDNVLSYLLTVVPMFILMGQLAFYSGISDELFELAHKWLARLPGGLACAGVVGSAMFAACTGSSLATAATMGKIVIPEMEKAGYHPSLASGSIAAAGTLGILIPPSIAVVIYAASSNESVAAMLIAGIIPGIISAVIYMGMIILRVIVKPELAPRTSGFSWKEKFVSIKGVWGLIVLFLLVMGSIYFGWATPTEAGAIGAFGTFLIASVRSRKKLVNLWNACKETVRTTSMIFTIFIGTTLFGFFISRSGLPMALAEVISNLPVHPMIIVIGLFLMYIPLGMFLDTISMILLTTPIVYPVVIALGFNGIWFGIIVIIMCEVALITPPVAFNIYVVKGVVPHIPLEEIIKGVMPFFAMDLLTIAIFIVFPQLILWLPSIMIG